MDQPQEEIISSDSSHVDFDEEQSDEAMEKFEVTE